MVAMTNDVCLREGGRFWLLSEVDRPLTAEVAEQDIQKRLWQAV